MQNRLTLCTLILSLLLACSSEARDDSITVGYFDLPPHGTLKNGKEVGAALEYFDIIAKQMGVRFHYIQEPLSRLLVDKKIDLILYLGKTPAREKTHVFFPNPLFKMQGSITVRNDNPILVINHIEDLKHMKISIWQEGYLSPLLTADHLTLEKMTGDNVTERSLRKVLSGRSQGFYSPELLSVTYAIKKLGLTEKLRIMNLPEKPVELSPAFSKASATKYQVRFEKEFLKLQSRLPYSKFLETYQVP
ncbi:transporter substrate-binding domain-containing protein [Bdellovibrio svalbardensis]|uniref:Transporter substrate-binding domain-containing protein n=1 Tax=Bdellovibrio svalbardensis TaxID=2972972 RepID=A0ABT6DMD7_9BACT|nr:transporter substrate-binding domain-containing protein [Bdellovibrio svalbardensis]MDG0818035.1 transporter substrate-binding domain-containing protein [Bdellovibrio svalbardensis]